MYLPSSTGVHKDTQRQQEQNRKTSHFGVEYLIATHTWENSEHNPANYPDYQQQDATTKEHWTLKGQIDCNEDQTELDNQIRTLEALLIHPDEIEKIESDL